jgi:putative ABC transport system permease protein
MIWADRKSNTWILIELIVVFSILWFCSGFVYDRAKRYFEPVGFDIDHVYMLEFDYQKDIKKADFNDEALSEAGITIFDRVKKNPMIEEACYTLGHSYPYSGSYSSNVFYKNGNLRDSINFSASIREVSPEFFDVFRIKFQKGKTFNPDEAFSGKHVIVSPDRENRFYDEDISLMEVLIKNEWNPEAYGLWSKKKPETEEEWNHFNKLIIKSMCPVDGTVEKIKRDDYGDYERIVFNPMDKNKLNRVNGWAVISVRAKAGADKDFPAKFRKEMKEQLNVAPFELVGVKPYKDIRSEWNKEKNEEMQTTFVVVFFLLINVFLGILGTFRFRTNARRGEIGLRCALGSGKSKIRQLLLGETFALLFLSSIPGTIIALNIQLTGVTSKLGITTPSVLTYFITFFTMLIIVWLGTWYPAKKASEIQPAEALHYE